MAALKFLNLSESKISLQLVGINEKHKTHINRTKHKTMKKLLLLPITICLLFAGCQDPDDDVDMPDPQAPISEVIKGEWNLSTGTWILHDTAGNIVSEDTAHFDDNLWIFSEDDILIPGPDDHDARGGAYTLTKSEGKNYIEFNDKFDGYAKFEITAITDNQMTWVMNDSLAALSEVYSSNPGDYRQLEFTR